MFHVPETQRLRSGTMGSKTEDGNNGFFLLPPLMLDWMFVAMASEATDAYPWEHVSVRMQDRRDFDPTVKRRSKAQGRMRIPSWTEMCHIKHIFWDAEDVVIQYHPAESQYVSVHDYVLHLWRPTFVVLPTPPLELIGSVTGARVN